MPAAAGLGGITIWEAGKPYPAWPMKFRRRILFKGPVRSTVEVDLDGFKTDQNRYDIRERFSNTRTAAIRKTPSVFMLNKPSNAIQFSLGFTQDGQRYVISSMRQTAISARGDGRTISSRR